MNENFDVKIIDFGFVCTLTGKNGSGFNFTKVGTPGFMAPELVKKTHYSGHVVDLFALGVCLFIMYTGHPPFNIAAPSDDLYNLLWTHQYARFWQVHSLNKPKDFFSETFQNLIVLMFQERVEYRPCMADVVGHAWVKEGQPLTPD